MERQLKKGITPTSMSGGYFITTQQLNIFFHYGRVELCICPSSMHAVSGPYPGASSSTLSTLLTAFSVSIWAGASLHITHTCYENPSALFPPILLVLAYGHPK